MQAIVDEALELMSKFEKKPKHARYVASLSLQLFEQTQSMHQLDASASAYLQAGALLHDIGWHLAKDGKQHHKASAEMIRAHAWKSLPSNLVQVVALIARYHRKAYPQASHHGYMALNESDRKIVSVGAAVLRIADALDHSHLQHIKIQKIQESDQGWGLQLECDTDSTVELIAFNDKKDWFEYYFHKPVYIEFIRGSEE